MLFSSLGKPTHYDLISHESFSKGARPDAVVMRGAPDGMHHMLLELKNITPISSADGGTGDAGTFAAMGNSSAEKIVEILGSPAIGGREGVNAKYVDAIRKGHLVVPIIHETFGGFGPEAADLLMRLAVRARRKTPDGEEPPWAARTFVPYHSQLISAAVQCEAAEEILDRVRMETGVRQGAHERAG